MGELEKGHTSRLRSLDFVPESLRSYQRCKLRKDDFMLARQGDGRGVRPGQQRRQRWEAGTSTGSITKASSF